MFQKIGLLVVALGITTVTHAEVVLDGTLGSSGALQGPDFAIESHLGQQLGNNLFHSFGTFNLNHNESAIFSGPNSIKHVISRVTGGKSSYINGLLRSTIPNADMYFLNPAGIMFGEQARLDVQGSLHVSTANYLRLGEEGRFDATRPEQSLLTVAPPTAFGFLDESFAGISTERSFLAVPGDKTLSFTGGHLTFRDSQLTTGENLTIKRDKTNGQVYLVSVASAGEVFVNPEAGGISTKAFEQYGRITITDSTPVADRAERDIGNIDVSGAGGGKVYIHGGQIFMENAYIFTNTSAKNNNQGITINATDTLTLTNGTKITAESLDKSSGKAGSITLTADKIRLTDGTQLVSTTQNANPAGNITATATAEITIAGQMDKFSSGFVSNTVSTGTGGQITVIAPTLAIDGGVIRADTDGLGNAGNVLVQVDTLTLKDGGQINSSAGNKDTTYDDGNGGTLTIEAQTAILITGYNSGLLSNVFTAGEGGTIKITAPVIEIQDGGTIQAGTQGLGKGGTITINVGNLTIKNNGKINASTLGFGQGGDVKIQARHISLTDKGTITARSDAIGDAGYLELQVEDSLCMQNGFIQTEAVSADGGDITIYSPGYLYLTNSQITTDVKAEEGDGGNITLNPKFLALDDSKITAKAVSGDGGNINITTTAGIYGIYDFSKSIIDASSEFGLDGVVKINSPDVDIDERLLVLPKNFLGGASLLDNRCASLTRRDLNRFMIISRDALPPTPTDLITQPYIPYDEE